nr:hypothetical protein [Shouchella miscanthi]
MIRRAVVKDLGDDAFWRKRDHLLDEFGVLSFVALILFFLSFLVGFYVGDVVA